MDRMSKSTFTPAPLSKPAHAPLSKPAPSPLSKLVLSLLSKLTLAKLALVLVALSFCVVVSPSGAQATGQGAGGAATTPAQGSPERKALLDAVRARLKIKSQFKVNHLKAGDAWAYFDGGEVVDAGGGEWQETDLSVRALLARKKTAAGKSAWAVVEIWTLPTDGQLSAEAFRARLQRRRRGAGQIPAGIFPPDL